MCHPRRWQLSQLKGSVLGDVTRTQAVKKICWRKGGSYHWLCWRATRSAYLKLDLLGRFFFDTVPGCLYYHIHIGVGISALIVCMWIGDSLVSSKALALINSQGIYENGGLHEENQHHQGHDRIGLWKDGVAGHSQHPWWSWIRLRVVRYFNNDSLRSLHDVHHTPTFAHGLWSHDEWSDGEALIEANVVTNNVKYDDRKSGNKVPCRFVRGRYIMWSTVTFTSISPSVLLHTAMSYLPLVLLLWKIHQLIWWRLVMRWWCGIYIQVSHRTSLTQVRIATPYLWWFCFCDSSKWQRHENF